MFFQGLQFTLSIWYSQFLPFLYINRSMIYISQYKPQKFCIKIVILHIKRRKISYFMAIDNFDCRPVCLWSFLSSSKFKRTTTVQSCDSITVPIIKKNWSKLPLVQCAFFCISQWEIFPSHIVPDIDDCFGPTIISSKKYFYFFAFPFNYNFSGKKTL